MKKIMLVTMGTSLFSSASWEFDDWVLNMVPLYSIWQDGGDWVSNPGPLYSPEKRQRSERADDIVRSLETNLTVENADEWAPYFATPEINERCNRACFRRFSAEVSTILELGMAKSGLIKKYLESFEKISLVADPSLNERNKHNSQYVAAVHTKVYLESNFNLSNFEILEIPGLASKTPSVLLKGFNGSDGLNRFIEEIDNMLRSDKIEKFVIIATGGYKIYGVFLGQFIQVSPKVSIVYRHELGDELIIITKDKITIPSENKKEPNTLIKMTQGL